MSHFTRVRCDIPTSACRTSHVRGATFQRAHVALHTCAARHSKERMSHFTRARRDIPKSACRTSRVRGATFQRAHVALHACALRHSKERMSHFTRAERVNASETAGTRIL